MTPLEKDHRGRIVHAAARLAAEHGESSVTVERVVERAGVSRETFYEQFEDRNACLSAVLDEFALLAAAAARAACATRVGWEERVRALLLALLVFLDENPELARASVARALSCGLTRAPGGELLGRLIPLLDSGSRLGPDEEPPPEGAAIAVIGSVLGVIHARLMSGDEPRLAELLNPLMGIVVLPYLGEAAALGELARRRPGATEGQTGWVLPSRRI